MQSLPLVTVMIPTYNHAGFIIQAIESALSQQYENLEIVVADDCSSDNTFQNASAIKDTRIKCFKNEKNIGRVKNYRRTLYERANGEWVVNLDGDDYFCDNEFISNAISAIQSTTKDVVFFQARNGELIDGQICSRKVNFNGTQILLKGTQYFSEFFTTIGSFAHAATLYNRKAAMELGFYRMAALISDFESLMRLAITGSVILSKDVVAVWREHNANESLSLDEKSFAGEMKAIQSICDFAKNKVGEAQCELWRKTAKANREKALLFINQRASKPRREKIKTVLSLFKFKPAYVKQLIKIIIAKQ